MQDNLEPRVRFGFINALNLRRCRPHAVVERD
jgi:hypothetical protein